MKADSLLFELIGKLNPKVTKHKFELVGGASPMGKKESSELLPTLYFWVINFSPPEPRILGLNLHDCREKMWKVIKNANGCKSDVLTMLRFQQEAHL